MSEFIVVGLLLIALPVLAQTSPILSADKPNPNSDRFPQPLPSPQPLPPKESPILPTPPSSTPTFKELG
ncbi:hypothetical protein [Fortiea contorta]|uniref:hypothetical protein n=1 Tax=Fortiea contorta TaxID=1892405 RepID=UPI000344EEC0|nr:hypothetical protein [Fortiea contorta]